MISEFVCTAREICVVYWCIYCRATLDIVIKPESGLSSPKERQLEEFICSCCKNVVFTELHPHTAISIVLQVENSNGAVSVCTCLLII